MKMRVVIACAALAILPGCETPPHRFVRLPSGERVMLVMRSWAGVESVALPCEWHQEARCRQQMEYVCGSGYSVLNTPSQPAPYLEALCWNRTLPWIEAADAKPCSNGGVTSGGVRIERLSNGREIAFAQRADVADILELYASSDPAFRYAIGDDWTSAMCWGGVWTLDNVAGFLRYLREQGAAIERADDGTFVLRQRVRY